MNQIPHELTIVIGSYLEPELVGRIQAAPAAARVIYEPGLLPVPRYQCDHTGLPRPLSAAELGRWRTLTAQADVFFDFDWLDPAGMAARAPNLRWPSSPWPGRCTSSRACRAWRGGSRPGTGSATPPGS